MSIAFESDFSGVALTSQVKTTKPTFVTYSITLTATNGLRSGVKNVPSS
jgi:hypothetical protein